MPRTEALGENLSRLRKQRGYTYRELGEAAGVPISYLHALEHGQSRRVGAFILYRIAEALDVRMETLMGLSELWEIHDDL